MWHEGISDRITIVPGNFSASFSLFVTLNGDIYLDDGYENGRVQKLILENNTWITVMNVNSSCSGLFVDIKDNLYCSMSSHHQVVKRDLNDSLMTWTRVAGTGTEGSASNELNRPRGIFVDVNLDLYVADCWNNRVQLFQSGQSDGITVAGGASSSSTISLPCPIGIVLDVHKDLFILNYGNHRIVGSGLHGWRCLVGCYGQGSRSNQLSLPSTLSFDRFGNLYVTDHNNNRIQKFQLLKNSRGKLNQMIDV